MAYERLVGLHVIDEAKYAMYREHMTPLLHAIGGEFRYDARVQEALKSPAEHPINRVFVISFPSEEAHARFFADERYLAVRREYFDAAVQGATTLAAYAL